MVSFSLQQVLYIGEVLRESRKCWGSGEAICSRVRCSFNMTELDSEGLEPIRPSDTPSLLVFGVVT